MICDNLDDTPPLRTLLIQRSSKKIEQPLDWIQRPEVTEC